MAEARKERTKGTLDLIVREAMRLFMEKGYHGTSIDDITHAVGLTKGALYYHFKSKDELLNLILEDFERRFLDGLIHAVSQVKEGTIKKFEKLARHNMAFSYYNREQCVGFTTLGAELHGADHPAEELISGIYDKYKKFIATLLMEGKKEKVFKKEFDTNLSALALLAFFDGLLLQWSMNRTQIDGKAYINNALRIILEGLMV